MPWVGGDGAQWAGSPNDNAGKSKFLESHGYTYVPSAPNPGVTPVGVGAQPIGVGAAPLGGAQPVSSVNALYQKTYGTGGGASGAAASSGGSAAPSGGSALNLNAQVDPALKALSNRYNSYLDTFQGNTGHFADILGQKIRDAAEGGRKAITQSAGFRGVKTDPTLAAYDRNTQRDVTGGLSDYITGREATYGQALQGALPITEAPSAQALAEKQLGLSAFTAENNAALYKASLESQNANNAFNQYLALLNAQRTSPVYTGYGVSY